MTANKIFATETLLCLHTKAGEESYPILAAREKLQVATPDFVHPVVKIHSGTDILVLYKYLCKCGWEEDWKLNTSNYLCPYLWYRTYKAYSQDDIICWEVYQITHKCIETS